MQPQNQTDQVTYTDFNELENPNPATITYEVIQSGLQSKEWRTNFETLTHLRQANRYYSNMFIEELLPRSYKQIIQQIDNLRSNNSKEALTLVSEIFQHQNLCLVSGDIMRPMVNAIFSKTVSEKGFLKKEALKAVNFLPKKYNPCFTLQLSNLTQSNNGSISELAITKLCDFIEMNKICEFDHTFYHILSTNLQGKRAVLQKKAKQIIQNLKKRIGQQKLGEQIQNFRAKEQITNDQANILIREVKKQASKKQMTKTGGFRDFLKHQKKENTA